MKTTGKSATEQAHDGNELLTQLSHAIAALRQVVGCEPSMPANSNLPIEDRLTVRLNVQNIGAAFAGVAKIQSALANSGGEISPESARALSHYERLLWQFKANLPRIQGWLLAERARLANRRSHSASVESWVRASRQTME